jgi:hypothetical protein
MATVPAPLADNPRSKRRHQRTWRKQYQEQEPNPGNACEPAHWATGRAKEEARSLFRFMINTKASPQQIAEMICVTDAEFEELSAWANASPRAVAVHINETMEFRVDVLRYFEELLEKEKPCLESMPGPS